MSIRFRKIMVLGSGERPTRNSDNLTKICEPIVLDNVGSSTFHNPIGLHGLLQGQLYYFYLNYKSLHCCFPDIIATNKQRTQNLASGAICERRLCNAQLRDLNMPSLLRYNYQDAE
jgi:hypothetical protein